MQKRRAPGPEAGQAVKKPGYSIDMVNGPLAGKLLLFALPLMLSSLLQLLFNAADVVVVGRYAGKEALAAVGSNGSLINSWSTSLSASPWAPTWWWPGIWGPDGRRTWERAYTPP